MAASAWEGTIRVNSELLQLTPAIFGKTSTESYSVSFQPGKNTTQAPIRSLRKHIHAPGHEWDGHDIILAVNIDRARVNAKFDLNFRYGSSSGGIMRSRFTREPLVRVLFEDRDVMVINDTIKDYFAPMDTHIYLLPPY